MPNALLIYEENETAQFITNSLHDMQFERCRTFSEATRLLSQRQYGLIVSDVTISDVDSENYFGWMEKYIKQNAVPLVFFSTERDTEKTLKALAMGADYISAPVHRLEFRARTIKHFHTLRRKENNEITSNVYGPLKLDPTRQVCVYACPASHKCRGEQKVRLTPTEFRLLTFLLKNQNSTVSRQEIHSAVWGEDIHIRIRAIDKHMHGLKNKMNQCHLHIECIYGEGYRLSILNGPKSNEIRPKLNDCDPTA